MDIALVTSWKVKCGIATYSEALSRALVNLDNKVYIVRLNRFGRKTVEYFETLATRRIPKADIINIELEYGLFSGGEGAFYTRLRQMQELTPIVTTAHATGNPIPDQMIAENNDAVIVHNEYCKRRFGHDCTVIPHGIQPRECLDKVEAKKKLGIDPDTAVVGLFGFISPYKGYEAAIRTVSLEFPDVTLLVAGGWHVDVDTVYIQNLKNLANQFAPGQSMWLGWTPEEDLPTFFGACDACLYPNKFISESGALLTMIGFGKCVLATALEPNIEREQKDALMTYKNEGELTKNLEKLLTDPDLRRKYEDGAKRLAQENCWDNVAKHHLKLYEDLL